MRPFWLDTAYSYLGLTEQPGPKNNPKIVAWWKTLRTPFIDDETPWCAAFVGGVLEECGIKSTRSAAAQSYWRTKWGQLLKGPAAGAVVVFWRGAKNSGTGHVGFVVGKDANNHLMVIGGNQGDAVTIKPFDTVRVISYHWPVGEPLPVVGFDALPLITSDGKVSENEA